MTTLTRTASPAIESHQKAEVIQNLKELRAVFYEPSLNPVQQSFVVASSHDPLALLTGRTSEDPLTADDGAPFTQLPTASCPSKAKLVHFVRHGEGYHNVAQREYRARPEYDGTGEPYTTDTDPEFKHRDAKLTEKGQDQARGVRVPLEAWHAAGLRGLDAARQAAFVYAKDHSSEINGETIFPWDQHPDPSSMSQGGWNSSARALGVQRALGVPVPLSEHDFGAVALMYVSPMRRATETGLLAAQFIPVQSVAYEKLRAADNAPRAAEQQKNEVVHFPSPIPVCANEDLHERGGRHTCDQRLTKTELEEIWGAGGTKEVNYASIGDEEDPLWHPDQRETWQSVVERALRFMALIKERDEKHVVVFTHSAFLQAVFLQVLRPANLPEEKMWFGTGEMKTVVVQF